MLRSSRTVAPEVPAMTTRKSALPDVLQTAEPFEIGCVGKVTNHHAAFAEVDGNSATNKCLIVSMRVVAFSDLSIKSCTPAARAAS